MYDIGIVDRGDKLFDQIKDLLEDDKFNVFKINDKKQIEKLDALVIYENEQKEQLADSIYWLINSEEYSNIFVWFFSERLLSIQEQSILLRLGVNGIITLRENFPILKLSIENTFNKLVKNKRNKSGRESILNEANQTITVNDSEKNLTRKEYKLLSILFENQNQTVSYQDLMKYLWPDETTENTYKLANIVFKLREKTENSKEFEIKTTRSVGYVVKFNN